MLYRSNTQKNYGPKSNFLNFDLLTIENLVYENYLESFYIDMFKSQ